MSIRLSKERICSFVGDVLPISLVGDGIDRYNEVKWSVIGDAALVRTFTRDGRHTERCGALITLVREGSATVLAEYQGEKYTLEVTATARKSFDASKKINYYIGDMHHHTSMDHNPDSFAEHKKDLIEDYTAAVFADRDLDFGVISDHAGVTNDHDFFHGFELAGEGNGAVLFAGSESEVTYTEVDRLGVLHRLSGEIVTINSAGYSDSRSFSEFEQDMAPSPRAIGIFAHPHVVGFSTNGIWNFNFASNNTPRMLEMMRGIEMGNGGDRKENLLHEYAYSQALDAGFRLSTTCGSDSHGSAWSRDLMPGKTVIMANERTREAFVDALVNNRFYATESGNIKLKYTVNGKLAPCDLSLTDTYTFKVDIDYFRELSDTRPILVEVISDYGNPLCIENIDGDSFEITVKSDSARYFYLRLIDSEGRKTWSPPVFTGRAYDRKEARALGEIDLGTATCHADGREAPVLINGNPMESWYGVAPEARIVIDLGEKRSISAVGYYPHIILRGKDKGPDWTTSMESAGLVSEYRILVSSDGEEYSEVRSGRMQALGSENILDFERTEARFVCFEVLSTVGHSSHLERYKNSAVRIANLSLFS